MSDVIIPTRFQWRRDTAANWASNNPIPLQGEPCLETDTGKWKIGDGSTAYNSLAYQVDSVNGQTGAVVLDAADIGYDNTTSGLSATTTQAAIDELAVSSGGGAWDLVKKASSETRTSTTTLADDSALTLALAASSLYRVRFFVIFNIANATMDFKWDNAYTGTYTTAYRRVVLQRAGRGSPAGTDNELVGTDSGLPTSILSDTTSGIGFVEVEFLISTTTAGTLAFRWAQNTSDPGNCTVLAGSYIEWAKFA